VTVVFAGGGTGGHLYPAIAIADALRRRAAHISFIGSADRLETTIVPKAGYPLYTIAAHALPRGPSLRIFRAIAANLKGTLQSFALLREQRPDLVVATGGYVSFPVALAARIARFVRLSRAALVLLEPNVSPGLTNRLLAPIVDEVWRGVPVRSSLRRLPAREEAATRLGLDASRKTLVAVGGSQGARAINDALLCVAEKGGIPQGWQLLHVAGASDHGRVVAQYRKLAPAPVVVRSYLEDMADAYAVADLLLTRAGASTLGELSAVGKPAIVVPYPFAADEHQSENAAALAAAGAVVVLADRKLAETLPAVLAETTEPRRLAQLTENARQMQGSDPLVAILARIESLVPRKDER
jgi:UDP-N-acetylglucosamine--N-acetylmuramyl-(pentapeptide) pyrophosphoryl-undecaprenol N-acetylglucosamine transferase